MKQLFIPCLFLLIGCGGPYGWNLPPNDGSGTTENIDPCTTTKESQVIGIMSIDTSESKKARLTIVVKSPCSSVSLVSGSVLSLAVYDVNNFSAPNDLTVGEVSPVFAFSSKCNAEGVTIKSPIDPIKNPETAILIKGSAISLLTGKFNRSSLFQFGTKINYENITKGDDGCFGGTDFSPFIMDQKTGSSLTDHLGNKIISSTSEGGAPALFGRALIGMGAPYYTFGVLSGDKAYKGLKSIPGIDKRGSLYQFKLAIKPGNYYFVLSHVPSPTSSVALTSVKVYGGDNTPKDYETDCGKSIPTCAKAVTIR